MTNRALKRHVRRELEAHPPHGPVSWPRACALCAAGLLLVVFWLGVFATVANAQDLTVYNFAHVPAKQLRRAERDAVHQANDQLAPAWQLGRTRFVKSGGWPVYLRSSGHSMDPAGGPGSAIGYHFINGNRPFAVVWTGSMFMYGYPWQTTLSHEIMEILVDPTTVRLLGGPTPDTGWVAEVCDPVEDWSYDGYRQDFVTPAWFVKASPGPWDYMRRLSVSRRASPNGSEDYWDGQQWQSYKRVHANEARWRHVGPPPPSVQAFMPVLDDDLNEFLKGGASDE